MQLFIDNWSASLLAPATAEAVSLSVEPSLAARLVGLGEGDFYELTLVEQDAAGLEIDWEVVTVTGRAVGVLTVTRSVGARAWGSGALIEARLTASAMETLRDAAGGTTVGSAPPQALGLAGPGTSPQASRQDHVHPAPTPGDIGAATAAQGEKADTAVQPAALASALADKVDKVAGKELSSNDYTTAEKNKLAGIAPGATANTDTDTLAEGSTNKYFTEGRVRSTLLTGLSLLAGGAIAAADSVLVALGKLQKQISDAVTAISGKQDTLVSGTSIKTVNGSSLLGAGDLSVLPQVVAYAGTGRDAGLSDINKIIDCTSGAAVAINIPAQSTVAWPADAEFHVRWSGTGAVSLTGAAGVTVPPISLPVTLAGQGAIVTLKRRSADVWAVVGTIQGDQTITGSLSFAGNARRLSALMDGSSNAFAAQNNVTNGSTIFDVIPNGTSTSGQLRVHNKSDRTGGHFLLAASNTGLGIFSGGASPLPLSLSIGLTASWNVDNASPYAFRPGADNTQPLGTASFRPSVVYAGSSTISTSDAREKTEVREFTAAEIEASKQLAKEVGAYRFLSAVAEKGAAAREHIGMTVQRAIEVMEQHGLDPFGYGFICFDSWGELPELTEEIVLGVVTKADGYVLADGVPDPGEELPDGTTWTESIRETVVVRPFRAAGDRYSFRTDELLLFIARGFDARLSALENA